MKKSISLNDSELTAEITQIDEKSINIYCEGNSISAEILERGPDFIMAKLGDKIHHFFYSHGETTINLTSAKTACRFSIIFPKNERDDLGESNGSKAALVQKSIFAPMPGLIVDIFATLEKTAIAGQKLLVIEAMKMENEIKCPRDARIKEIHVSKGEPVEKGQKLLTFH